jgi:hypothetical protein
MTAGRRPHAESGPRTPDLFAQFVDAAVVTDAGEAVCSAATKLCDESRSSSSHQASSAVAASGIARRRSGTSAAPSSAQSTSTTPSSMPRGYGL